MIVDMHIHVVGRSSKHENHLSDRLQNSRIMRRILKQNGIDDPHCYSDEEFDESVLKKVAIQLEESRLDHGVVLALDAAYSPDGKRMDDFSEFVISNDFIVKLAEKSKKVLMGGSVHPYRKDALAELERCINNGAKLIKWIPSVQNIDLEHPQCVPFYTLLKKHRIPLLVHIGNEHSLKSFNTQLNHISKIKTPLDMGVTVIAAHLGTRMFYHEKCFFKEWTNLLGQHENLYGDISAFTLPLRTRYLKIIHNSPDLTSRVFYGSDFPATHTPLSFIHKIGLRNYFKIKHEPNVFNRSYRYYRALGVPSSVFSQFLGPM